MTGLPRTQEGGFQHLTSDCVNEEQLWDDTLFMTVLFLYRAGLALDRAAWREEARYQFLLHIKYLHCHQNGLWYHGWCSLGRHHFGEAFWARGNSWFTAGAVDFVEWLPEGEPVRRCVLETWREQCRAIAACQDEATGLWHTLLDHADSYLETSAGAAIDIFHFAGRVCIPPCDFQHKRTMIHINISHVGTISIRLDCHDDHGDHKHVSSLRYQIVRYVKILNIIIAYR